MVRLLARASVVRAPVRPHVPEEASHNPSGRGWRGANWREGFVATLVITSISLPVVGAVLVVALYIGGPSAPPLEQRWTLLGAGSAAAVVVWVLVALFAGPYATARRANVASFDAIRQEVEELGEHLAVESTPGGALSVATALHRQVHDAVHGERRELRWLSGAGYVDLWMTLHRAQEALLEAAPVPYVVEQALEYRWRLQDSTITNASMLLANLRRAVMGLDASAAVYMADPPGKCQEEQAPAPPPPADVTTVVDHSLERVVVRQVVHDVNDFRDKRRGGLVHARNQLLRTVAFAGLVIYVLVALAIIVGAPPAAMLAAATFYFIGAIVGLFNRLYLDSQADTASEEDFGLSVARLLNTPIFSGLAAIGGVVVTAMLPLSVTQAAPPMPVALEQTFNLSNYPFGCLIAAVFGLTPSLLIGRLSQPIEQYKQDLRSTETQGGK